MAAELMEFAEEFRSPDKAAVIEPERFATALNIQSQELAKLARVHRATLKETPENARLQKYLRDALRAMSAAYEIAQDRDRAIFWFRNSPIPEFDHCTAEDLVAAGKVDAVVKYLAAASGGSTG